MLKIKSLKEIIEPIANKKGWTFKEYLDVITEDQCFDMLMEQLISIANSKSIRDDNKLIQFFKSKNFFIDSCVSKFEFIPNDKHISEFDKLTVNLLDKIKPYNEDWMTNQYLFDILSHVEQRKSNLPDFEKRVYHVMSIVYVRSLEVGWNNLWFNPTILERFKPYEKYL